ncbi:hypothetical protein OUZ56_027673 [Daphnia magna]|uniref:Uncharacterized protein n=1 Tax=Daphnia magna TaxID=35525 RepID=A0ABR0B1K5_9CRUS|nr:hypothetical protein OUZ56_027673 [Daphnia magna]
MHHNKFIFLKLTKKGLIILGPYLSKMQCSNDEDDKARVISLLVSQGNSVRAAGAGFPDHHMTTWSGVPGRDPSGTPLIS